MSGIEVIAYRGLSSAGRASALQAEGHRFDPDRLHHSLRSWCHYRFWLCPFSPEGCERTGRLHHSSSRRQEEQVCSLRYDEVLPVSPTIVKKKTDLEGSSPKSPQGFCLLLRGAAKAASTVLSVKGSGRRFIAFVQVITPFAIDRCCLTAHRRGSSREAGLSPVGFSHPTGKMAPLQDVGSGCTPGRC